MTAPKILLIGWETADWEIIRPLLEAGALPNLERMVERGVMGNLRSVRPMHPALGWNSIATGKRADKHGILGMPYLDPGDGRLRAEDSASRRSKALWQILSEANRRCHVINWPASHPAERVSGAAVSEGFIRWLHCGRAGTPLLEGGVFPAGQAESLLDFAVRPGDIDPATLGLFVPKLGDVDQDQDRSLEQLAWIIAECATVHAVTTHFMEASPWEFMAAYYPSLGRFSQRFMQFRSPRLPHIGAAEFEIYKDVVDGAYRFHDLLLGRLLELAGSDATVILCSECGYQSGPGRSSLAPERPGPELAGARDPGVLAICGPGVRADDLVHGASVLDIAPTALTLAGLPLAEDLDGRPLLEIFERPILVERTPSEAGAAGPAENGVQATEFRGERVSPALNREAAQVQAERDWTLARVHLEAGRISPAVPLLERIHADYPLRAEVGLALAECYLYTGLIEEAGEIVPPIVEAYPWDARALRVAGALALAAGKRENGLELLAKSLAASPSSAEHAVRLASLYLNFGYLHEAEACYAQALSLAPDHAAAHAGHARCLLKRGRWEASARAALEATGRQFNHAEAHLILGIALRRLGQLDRAIQAFETALRFDPYRAATHRFLLSIYRTQPWRQADVNRIEALVRDSWQRVRGRVEHVQKTRAIIHTRRSQGIPGTHNAHQPDTAAHSEFSVRAARARDLPFVVRNLPLATQQPSHCRVFVLESGPPRDEAGCCALAFRNSDHCQLSWSVEPNADRSLALRALLEAALAWAAETGFRSLQVEVPIVDSSEDAGVLRELGFTARKTFRCFELGIPENVDAMRRLRVRLERKQAIPASARVIPLSDAPHNPVSALIAREIGHYQSDPALLADPFHRKCSAVAMDGAKVVGALLLHQAGDGPWIRYLAVAPGHRNGWSTVLLISRVKALLGEGFTRIRFKTDPEHHRGAINFVRRFAARELYQESIYSLRW